MERFPLKRIAIPIIVAILIFALGVLNSIAEEKKKVSDTTYWFTTKTEAIKVNEAKGHIIQITESKGISVGRKELAICKNTWDLVKGRGTMNGYTTMMNSEGKVTRFLKQEGKVITFISGEGKPILTAEGTWTVIPEHGSWGGSEGGGTWKLKMVSDGIFIMDWEGELVE
jgi:hypothetical protein